MERLSETAHKLANELRIIYDDDEFLTAVWAEVHASEEDQQAILDFIAKGKNVSSETVSILALTLADRRKEKH